MTPDRFIAEAFSGSDADLIRSAKALLELDEAGLVVPHGIGGHARTLMTAFIDRFEHRAAELARLSVGDGELRPCPGCGSSANFKQDHGRDCSSTWIECSHCAFSTRKLAWMGDDKKEKRSLSTAWNTRAAGDKE